MALHVPKAPGYAQMLKDGARSFQGTEDALTRNIEACIELSRTTRSAYGPNGQNKIVINHIEKLFVTKDAATILKEMEVAHPAAKMLVLATQEMEQEVGDGTNFVFIFAGTLLQKAEEMLHMGLNVTDIIDGYEQACKSALEILPSLVVKKIDDLRNKELVTDVIRTVVMSKQWGFEDYLANLVSTACIDCLTPKGGFNTDNVRVCKILGAGVVSSKVMRGMVFRRNSEGEVKEVKNCKVAVYSCPLDLLQTETKGTILLETAEQLKNFSQGEETQMEEFVKKCYENGVKVLISGGKVGELALHYCNKFNILIVRVNSKWDLRRLCTALGATILPILTPPAQMDLGFCGHVRVEEIGEVNCAVFEQLQNVGAISTIIVRGSTENIIEDIERSIDDGVNTFKSLTKDSRLLAGAGATEIELALQLRDLAERNSTLAQYAMHRFGQSLECVVNALAENAGLKATDCVAELYAAHQKGDKTAGLVSRDDLPEVEDALAAKVFDTFSVRYWGIKLATAAACTVLKVDQIIMAKPAGQPKPQET